MSNHTGEIRPTRTAILAAIAAGLLGAAAWIAVAVYSVQRRGLARDRAAAEHVRRQQ